MLREGDKAPLGLHVLDSEGRKASLASFAGRYVILYFYPEDDSPDCTRQACDIRDAHDRIKKLDAVVIGVSPDSPGSHRAFIAHNGINFPLWSDKRHALMEEFGAWRMIPFMGDAYSHLNRSMFAIKPDGTIAKVWETINPEHHGEDIMNFLKSVRRPNPPRRPA